MVVLQRNIDGVAYQAVPEKTPGQCAGCAAIQGNNDVDYVLCSSLEDDLSCYDQGIIWAKVDPTAQLPGFGQSDIPKDATIVAKDNITNPIKDSINPDHYKVGGIETIEYLKAKLSPEEFQGYLKGNALKYLSRSNYKHEDPMEDFKKALWYVNRLTQG